MTFASDPALSAPPPAHRPRRRIDRLLSQALKDGSVTTLRQARLVAWAALLASFLYLYGGVSVAATEFIKLHVGIPNLIAAVGSLLLTIIGLLFLRFSRHLNVAAWIVTLTLAVSPAVQAALDLGLRDPVIAFVCLGPLLAAIVSGTRMSVVTAVVAFISVTVLLVLHRTGYEYPALSSESAMNLYSFLVAISLIALSTVAGVLYVRHSRRVLADADANTTNLDKQLRESESRFRSLFMEIPLGLCRSKPSGEIVMANPGLARLLGAGSVAEAMTLNLNDLYVDSNSRAAFQEELCQNEIVRHFEADWRRINGEIRTVRIGAYIIRNADGTPAFYEGTVEDITAERRVRTEMKRSEARFRALVNRSSDLTIVVDRSGRLTYASPSARTMLGRDPDLVVGTFAFELVHPEDQPDLLTLFRDALARTPGRALPSAPIELRVQHQAGHYIFVEGATSILFGDPAVEGLVINLRDMTERKRAQAVLVQAKRQAEEVAHLKSTFMANMSHEIRTPLTAILGFADVLTHEVVDPEHREFVELIASSGRRLMDTLNSVLDLARLEAGRGELSMMPLAVDQAVQEAVTLMTSAATERGLSLTADVEPDAEALLDDAAFARVLHNLIGNALKFTREGGVTLRVCANEKHVVVTVADTGIGIEPDFLPRLFGEFEQASTGVERTHEGAGLGLAISRQLVDRMDGVIKVESEVGTGTTFTLEFPRIVDHMPASAEAERPRILVVDDNDQALLVAERLLEEFYLVETAETGPAALAAVEADRPDAVLLDIHLGDAVSGEDIMRALRTVPGNDSMPIVAVTAYALPGDRARFIAAGFDDYLTKPYTREDLLAMLEAACVARSERGIATMIVRNRDRKNETTEQPRQEQNA